MAVNYIQGKITDSGSGKPIEMVNVFISDAQGNDIKRNGVTVGRTTDSGGNFAIPYTETDAFVTMSYVGYTPLTIPVGNASKLKAFKMMVDENMLPDIPIVASAVQKLFPEAKPSNKKILIIALSVLGFLLVCTGIYFLIKKRKK